MKQLNNHSIRRIRFRAPNTSLLSIFIAGLFILVSCKKELDPTNENNELVALSKSNTKEKQASIIVHAGGSIQTAVNTAPAGSVIKIEPGTYSGSIVINKPGITLMGASEGEYGEVVIKNSGDQENGITVQENGDGFVLKNVTVRDFEENGVVLTGVDGFLLSHVNAINNGEYGLFPVFSKNGVIDHCITSGHSDTGIYVGQSSSVTITQNEAYDNVNGIEIENSSFVTADKNHSYNNVVGIMAIVLPGLTVKEGSNIVITKNHVNDNNHVNFAKPGELESVVPSGSGILIVGCDNTLVQDNHVTGNKFVGVAVVSTVILGSLAGLPPEAFADIEPNANNVKIISNLVKNNGFNPPVGLPLPGVDLLWDGSGNGNCWSKNVYSSSYPLALPACL